MNFKVMARVRTFGLTRALSCDTMSIDVLKIDRQKKDGLSRPSTPEDVIPSDNRERWEWIKYRLRLKGFSLADVARAAGVHRSAPSIAYRTNYPKMQAAIANTLGCLPEVIWPERYPSSLKKHDTSNRLAVNG